LKRREKTLLNICDLAGFFISLSLKIKRITYAKKSFKEYSQGQGCLFPVQLETLIPSDSPTRLVNQIVNNLDITKVIDTYKGDGTSPYHPCMMLKIVLFAYLNNIYSCRKIENNTRDRVGFMWLSAMQTPDHNTINTFRSSHLKDTISDIFTQVVVMLVEMGYLSPDTVYVDGTKIESRANRYTFVRKKSVEKNEAKPAYNLQISTENQFFTHYDMYLIQTIH
jgi:transposase